MKHNGTKRLETKRLVLRRFEITDAEDAYYNWCNNSNVAKYVMWQAHKNVEETKELIDTWIKKL